MWLALVAALILSPAVAGRTQPVVTAGAPAACEQAAGAQQACAPAAGVPTTGEQGNRDPAARDPAAGEPAAGEPAACEPAACDPATGDPATGVPVPRSAAIYVARRGWHVDVGFAASDIGTPLGAIARQLPGARYLFFGFGDRRYLMSAHHGAPAMLTALWPGAGLILVTGLTTVPGEAFGAGHVIRLAVSQSQRMAAQQFIWRSLQVPGSESPDGIVPVFARGPYEGSVYYASRARYSALHTCNTWVAELLEALGLPVRSKGVMLAGQLWHQVRRLAAAQSLPAPNPTD